MTNVLRAGLLCRFTLVVSSAAIGVVLVSPLAASAAAIVFSGSGADVAAIQASVDALRASIGGVNNGNLVGSQPTGRREINWDGGGAAANATQFASPMNTFNSGATTAAWSPPRPARPWRSGAALTGVRGHQPHLSRDLPDLQLAEALCGPRQQRDRRALLRARNDHARGRHELRGSVHRRRPAKHLEPAIVQPVGRLARHLLRPEPFNNGLSFLGLTSTDLIGRVRIVSGNTALGPNDGGAVDVVALDDFIYSEPQAVAVPEPASLLLLGTGLAKAMCWRRGSRTVATWAGRFADFPPRVFSVARIHSRGVEELKAASLEALPLRFVRPPRVVPGQGDQPSPTGRQAARLADTQMLCTERRVGPGR